MCSGSFDAKEGGTNHLLNAMSGGTLGTLNMAKGILDPKTKTKVVAKGADAGFGAGMTSATTNDAGNTDQSGYRKLYTDKASLTERIKGSIGANSIAGDVFGINGQRENIKYVLAPGKTVQGTKRVL